MAPIRDYRDIITVTEIMSLMSLLNSGTRIFANLTSRILPESPDLIKVDFRQSTLDRAESEGVRIARQTLRHGDPSEGSYLGVDRVHPSRDNPVFHGLYGGNPVFTNFDGVSYTGLDDGRAADPFVVAGYAHGGGHAWNKGVSDRESWR